MIAEPAADGDESAFVGRDNQFESQVTDGHLIAGRRDAPAIEQQVLIRLQALLPSDCRAVNVFTGLADWITIGRPSELGAGESDRQRNQGPCRLSSC